ncbi:MAG: beta-N-acetylglucosaminidase domain-containing protein, partial [Candidatus Binatia bacterium]
SMEMHIGPLTGRDPQLPEQVYAYLNNPLLQETLSLIPLATCFEYAADPLGYDPETSWEHVVGERFGIDTLPHWKTIREFCGLINKLKVKDQSPRISAEERPKLEAAHRYILENRNERWFKEFLPWLDLLQNSLRLDS